MHFSFIIYLPVIINISVQTMTVMIMILRNVLC